MDIYTLLKTDHQKVSEMFEKIAAARSDERRESLLEEVKQELLLHAHTEDATFYEALRNAGNKELQERMPHAKEEHEEIEELFEEIEKHKAGSAKWLITFGSLKHAVEHHVEEEEGDIFKEAKKVLNPEEARNIAREMQALKEEAMQEAA